MFHDGLINQRKSTVLKVRAKYLRALRLEMECLESACKILKDLHLVLCIFKIFLEIIALIFCGFLQVQGSVAQPA